MKITKKNKKAIIVQCIEEFEQKTQIELKLIIERQARGYWDHILAYCLLGNFLLLAIAHFSQVEENFVLIYFELIFLNLVLVIFLHLLMGVQFLIGRNKKNSNVEERALFHFSQQKMYMTELRSGMLMYYSRLEKRGIILTDVGVLKKISAAELLNFESEFNQAMNKKDFANELGAFIRGFGVFCHQKWPDETFKNELSNDVLGF
ncbi:MAG: hypothetical protein J0M15_13880 [Deltaproteobacteria bacterium]|jgi:uncharacterized membrane protein|nr:hypothetical protein [Deltaproteobacteria bacterium]